MENENKTAEDIISAAEQKRQELEEEFSYDGYKVIRKELIAHRTDPAMVIRNGSITFNTACINGLDGVVYVKMMFNEELGRLTAQECDPNDRNAVRWCIAKGDRRKSRKLTCGLLTDLIYKTMGWDKKYRYKVRGYLIEYKGDTLFVFDLKVHEIFHEKPKKGEEPQEPVDTRKGFYPEDIAGTFGVPVEEEARENEIVDMDGFVTMAALTGPIDAKEADQGDSAPACDRRDE